MERIKNSRGLNCNHTLFNHEWTPMDTNLPSGDFGMQRAEQGRDPNRQDANNTKQPLINGTVLFAQEETETTEFKPLIHAN
jgi:hypothetical protein